MQSNLKLSEGIVRKVDFIFLKTIFLKITLSFYLECSFLTATIVRGLRNHFFFFQSPFLNSQCHTGKLVFPVLHWIFLNTIQFQLLSISSYYPIPVTIPFQLLFNSVTIQFQLLTNSSYYPIPVTTPFQILSYSSHYPIPVTIQFIYCQFHNAVLL